MRLKICFLLYSLDAGGLENFLLRFIDFLGDEYEIVVVCKNGKVGNLAIKFHELGSEIIMVNSGYFRIGVWINLYNLFSKNRYDFVCDLGSNFSGIYMLLAYLARIKGRIAYYGQNQNHFKYNFFKGIYNRTMNFFVRVFSTKVITNSVYSFNYFFGNSWVSNPKYLIVENGVNPFYFSTKKDYTVREQLGIPSNAFVIGHTGRYDPKKNHKAILNVAKLLIENYVDVYFILVGKGTEFLSDSIGDSGLRNKVFVMGYRSDTNLLYQNFDCFLFPSYTEGLSNSLIEALLSGLPIIASNIVENISALPNELHPFLFAPDDIYKARDLILKIYFDRHLVNSEILRSYAEKRYNSNLRFEELLCSFK